MKPFLITLGASALAAPLLTGVGITPELFADRGIAWVKAVFEVLNAMIANFGLLAVAAIGVWQNLKIRSEVKERLDRQGEKLAVAEQNIQAVALATPPPVVVYHEPQPTEPDANRG